MSSSNCREEGRAPRPPAWIDAEIADMAPLIDAGYLARRLPALAPWGAGALI